MRCCPCRRNVVAIGRPVLSPEQILQMKDLTRTKVVYSWSDFFTLEGGVNDVSAVLQGDGRAVLCLGGHEPIEAKITPERYRALLQTMADNGFSTIAVKRRWGVYLADFGRLCVVLEADGRQQAVYADQKHYVASPDPDRLQAILDVIHSFAKEFGCKLDYGPVAVSGVRDYRDVGLASVAGTAVLLVSGTGIVVWYFRRKRETASRTRGCRRDSQDRAGCQWLLAFRPRRLILVVHFLNPQSRTASS